MRKRNLAWSGRHQPVVVRFWARLIMDGLEAPKVGSVVPKPKCVSSPRLEIVAASNTAVYRMALGWPVTKLLEKRRIWV